MIDLPGDSGDYHLLAQGIELSKNVNGLTCEIGLRRGGGTRVILDALAEHAPNKVHIAVDPYGSIEYEHKEGEIVRLDYTNDMYNDCMTNVFQYAKQKGVHFLFYKLEDTEFFKSFGEGVPVYEDVKRIETKYSFVHFDGPHAINPLNDEIDFFRHKTPVGAVWCFDDIIGYYDHKRIEDRLTLLGFTLIEKSRHKGIYKRVMYL